MKFSSFRRYLLTGTAVFTLALGQVGCSAFQPLRQTVNISSSPAGAVLTVNGQTQGKGPISIQLERNKDHTVVATLGGRSTIREINSKFSKTGILDVIGTILFLVPGIGLLTPGAWELDSTNITIQLPQ